MRILVGSKGRRGAQLCRGSRFSAADLLFGFFVCCLFVTPLLGQAEIVLAAEIDPKLTTPVNFQSVLKGYRSGVKKPQQIVVRSQSEWLDLWKRHSSELYSTPPTVLFDQEVVAAMFLGEKNTGGYDVTIVRAERSGDELVIYYQEKAPAPGSLVTQAFMQPFHLVRIPSKDVGAKVTFRREP